MRKFILFFLFLFIFLFQYSKSHAQPFSLASVKSYPFPTELTSSATGSRIAWAFNEEGKRNIYVAEGPEFIPRKLTNYNQDDGQEITSLSISQDGNWVVYVRGGDHGGNWGDDLPVNPGFNLALPKVQVWSISFAGGESKAIGEGDEPSISPKNDSVVFIKAGQPWIAPVNASSPAKNLFTTHGTISSLEWSPNGLQLAFISDRGDHSLVGIYNSSLQSINWIAPSFARDRSPQWSPEGTKIVFIRTPGGGGPPDSILSRHHQPWAIWTADITSAKAAQIWSAPVSLRGSVPNSEGGFNLHWAANDRIVFLSYQDGWPHLYSLASSGGSELLLTPGSFMAESINLSHDGKWLVFSANTGPDKLDMDRRHVVRVPVDKPAMEVLTPGPGLEWSPVVTGDGSAIAMISATSQRPPLPAILPFTKGSLKILASDHIPPGFPQNQLVTPKQIIFKSEDGVTIHAQLFEPAIKSTKKPAIVYVHGGPPRQMLLGWHYFDYYSNAYATNQYLASLGFTVLSVNYRLGIGYGFEFQQPEHAGRAGASEYKDIRAAATWLANQPDIDKTRIGIYGGSYGGYLTALALSRDSKLFAAGVDIHGVHDWTMYFRNTGSTGGYEKVPDLDSATKIAWFSSPVSSINTWTSPVLIIHADDDRNVLFSQSTDLVRRLTTKGIPAETLVIVDDTHHWMKHSNYLLVGNAIADYFKRKLMK